MQKIFYIQCQAFRNQVSLSVCLLQPSFSFRTSFPLPKLSSSSYACSSFFEGLMSLGTSFHLTRKPSIYDTGGSDPTPNFSSFYKHLDPFSTVFHILFQKKYCLLPFICKALLFLFWKCSNKHCCFVTTKRSYCK